MKIYHDYRNAHIGNGASNMNENVDPKRFRESAEYMAFALGFTEKCEITHPATYGVRRNRVI